MSRLPEVGEVLDGFRIEERIHAGGLGVIYRVSGPEVGFPIIMKIPRLGHGEPGESVVTFEVERMVLGGLKGPHVPRLVAVGDIAAVPYLVMEYVAGQSLKEWVERAPIPAEEVARLGAALATAVHSLHMQEAIHLDLKPSNVIVRPGGEAVLIDFGLAHHAHFPDLLAEEFRHPVGSAPYISPEQVRGIRNDPRSDIFSIGVTLYELATGRLPHGSPQTLSGLRKRLFRDPVPPRGIVRSVPEWLQEVILRCLEPEPDRRFGSAAQLAFDLTHPDQVAVTERGRRQRTSGLPVLFRRWFRAHVLEPTELTLPSEHLASAPILLVAIATRHTNEAFFQSMRDVVKRLLALEEKTRLACITVIRPLPEVGSPKEEEVATSQRIKQLVQLRHWAEPLQLPADRISFHVLEAGEPADALLEYARANNVDHIVIGAPPADRSLKGLINTVSTKVAARAPCTVTVVRPPRSG